MTYIVISIDKKANLSMLSCGSCNFVPDLNMQPHLVEAGSLQSLISRIQFF
jgi:hypothetical protein